MPEPWSPKVEKRVHPLGEQGVRSSLDEVAKKAAEGAMSFRVKRWIGDIFRRAKNQGIAVNTPKARAVLLLKAVQQKLWIPDPVGVEFIPGAHLLACDKDDADGPCMQGDDCDGKAVLLGAAFSAAGIHSLIAGHAYNKERNISHVLNVAHAENRWWYADGSTEFPLGECVRFTRERLLGVPNGKMLCDKDVCLTDAGRGRSIDPDDVEPLNGGTFVGVNGLPQGRIMWLNGLQAPARVRWLG